MPQIDYSKSINEQKLLKDTRVILSLIYRDYICTKEEREEIDERDRKEMRKKEREAQIKYSYDNLFKKKNKAEKANSINEEINTKVVEYKENISTIEIKNKLMVGDTLEIIVPNQIEPVEFKIEELYDVETNE